MLGRKPGEWLWGDDGYGYGAELAGIKATLSARGAGREWSSRITRADRFLDSGGYFQRDWMRSVPSLPPRSALRVYGGSDLAVTATRRRLHRTRRDRHGPGGSAVAAGPVAWADGCRRLGRGVLRPGPSLEADRLGRGDRADPRRPWSVPGSAIRERRAFVARHAFPTRGDKRSGRNRSGVAWRSTGCMSRLICRIGRRSRLNCCRSRRAGMTIRSTRWAWWGSCSTCCCRRRPRNRLVRPPIPGTGLSVAAMTTAMAGK